MSTVTDLVVREDAREWPEEAIVAAIQGWAEEHGGEPPRNAQWRSAGPGHPSSSTCVKVGWNNLLLKAGFDLRRDLRPETQAEMERMLREGKTLSEVADWFGCTPSNVCNRMNSRGMRLADLRPAVPSITPTTRNAIRSRRKALGLSRKALATASGVSIATIRRLECGQGRPGRGPHMPSQSTLAALAQVLDGSGREVQQRARSAE